MTDEPESAVTTAENSTKAPGKPFVKGDSRINRKGRPKVPKSAIELQKLIDEIAAEEVEHPVTHEKIQRLRLMLRSMMMGKDTSGKVHILDRRYGKVTDKIDLSNSDGTLKPETNVDQIAQRVAYLLDVAKQRKEHDGS